MLEFIYINYVLLVGTNIVIFLFLFSLSVSLFNFFYDLLQDVWKDIKRIFNVGKYLIKNLMLPLFRIWWVITRAPIFITLIILNSLKYLFAGMLRVWSKYWKSYGYVVQEDTIWSWDWEHSAPYFTSKFVKSRLYNLFRKYLLHIYPPKYKNNRYGYTLTFLWGYLMRWGVYIIYLSFYYVIFVIRKGLYYMWIKPHVIQMILFFFYYIYRSLGWWINVWFYKFCWNSYVFIRRQLYYFMPNWVITDIIQDLNLNWFEWHFEANMNDEDEDTPEDLFMNNPNKKIIDFFYNTLPITTLSQLNHLIYPYLFMRITWSWFFKYIIVIPLYFIGIIAISIVILLTDIICRYLILTHKWWWNIYRYLLRQEYNLYIFILNIHTYSWYQLLILPLAKLSLLFARILTQLISNYIPTLVYNCASQLLALIFYFIYAIIWCFYHLPALITMAFVWLARIVYRYRVILLALFLAYYWAYDQYSQIGSLLLGILQSSVEQLLRTIWFYIPIDATTNFTGSNKYEFVKYWGALNNINHSRLLHYYSHIWQPDLAYMGYYQLNLSPEQLGVSVKDIYASNAGNWPFNYNIQRGLKLYTRSFIEKEQIQWNSWFFKFIEGTYIWDPAPHLVEEWNQRNFVYKDFKQFFNSKYIYKNKGTPITDLFWFFQEDEMEKWDAIMGGLPNYYLFEPHVLQEESEVLPNTWKNWFYYDVLNTAYLIPFDFPIEGSKQGAPGYQPGTRPPHLFAMLNSMDPIEYSRATGRQKMGLPVLNAMHYVKIVHEFKQSLSLRKQQLVTLSTELLKDKYIWDELFSSNSEWQMRLFTLIAYPFKWFGIRFELIRISIYKYCVYTKTTFWLYYYYYDPQIRVWFYLSFIQKIMFIYPYKWLCFCWQVGNSVYPLPEKTVNFIWSIILYLYNYIQFICVYIYTILLQPKFINSLNSMKIVLFDISSQFVHKWFQYIQILNYVKQWVMGNIISKIDFSTISSLNLQNDNISFFKFNWWYLIYYNFCKNYNISQIYIYLSLDQYYSYWVYKYYCYMWYWNHILQGYIYLWENSFYINQGKYSWSTLHSYLVRERGTVDRRVIFDVISDWRNILAEGYVRDMGEWKNTTQSHYSWLKQLMSLFNSKDLGIYFVNYIFFVVWYVWDISCQCLHNLLMYNQTHVVTEWNYTIKGWAPMLMMWMNKIQYQLDNIYIYLQLPRRLNKYGLTYTIRGYDLLDELNTMYIIRRTNLGSTTTWKSLNMLTYLVLMVKYPNTWEHFTMLNNSTVFHNSNGLRVVANKILANLTAWSSGIYYIVILILLFLSNNFRNLLFCTTGTYVPYTNNREYRWQSGRTKAGAGLNWLFISREIKPFMKPYVDLYNKLTLHMDYYGRLMVTNNELPLGPEGGIFVRQWVKELHTHTFLHKTSKGFNYKRWYLSPMSIAYLLNPRYQSLYTNAAYSGINFNKFMAYAELRDICMQLSGQALEINRAYTEVHPTYLYHKSYIELHMKQLDKWYNYNFNFDKYMFDFNLPDWAWHKDGFNMRIFSSKNPLDLTQQLTYVYEDERPNYIPWTLFGWFLAIPLCLVIKPLAGLGQWLQHSGKEDPAWAWHLSYYMNNIWHHIYLFKYFYYLAGPWIPESKLLASMETDESEDYWHYHEQSAFLREFFYAYEDDEPIGVYELFYTHTDFLWDSSLEEMRMFTLMSFVVLICSLLFAAFKKTPKMGINLNQIYSNYYINQWNSVRYFLPIKSYFRKIFVWFWR